MKNIFYVLPILILFISCQEEGILTKKRVENAVTPSAELKYTATFVPTSGIVVSGGAKIYLESNQYKVVLDNFSVSSGPDLKVYLSKAAIPSEFVNLGSLTSQTIYPIPASIALTNYSHILIHCQQYNHLFAIASLTKN